MEFALLLLTILLSATCAGLVTHRLNVCKERISFRAMKAEEIYCVAEKLEGILSDYFANNYSLIDEYLQGEIEVSAEVAEAVGQHFSRLKMLTGFYFPTLRSSLSRVTSAASSSYAALHAYHKASRDGKEQLAQILDTSVVDLKDAFEAMKTNILIVGEREQVGSKLALFKRQPKAVGASRVLTVAA